MGTEEVKTKLSIEEAADNLLTFKIKGECKGEFPHPAKQPKEFAEIVGYLEKRGYVIKKGEAPKCLEYPVTLEGIEHFYGVEKDIHANL